VEEAILTGESTVVDKITDALEGELPLGDRPTWCFPVPPSAPAVASAW
jgi:magnesium-transporting ATPase (P-type)